jgi:hypothetical protein
MAKKNKTTNTKKPQPKAVDGTGQSGTPELRRKIRGMGSDAYHIGHDQTTNKSVMQNLVQVPLDYYAMRRWIEPRQYDAGAEFHRLWYYGAVKSRFAQMRMESALGGVATPEFNEVCRRKYEDAKKAFRSLAHALICFNVCCMGEFVNGTFSGLLDGQLVRIPGGRNQKSQWLKDGLDDLAEHFKFPK